MNAVYSKPMLNVFTYSSRLCCVDLWGITLFMPRYHRRKENRWHFEDVIQCTEGDYASTMTITPVASFVDKEKKVLALIRIL